jgi:hypothetical protein
MKRILALLLLACFPWQLFGAQFTLTWTDNSTNEAGFRIERSVNGTAFIEIATVGANVVTYVDAGLPNSTAYWYRLRAYNVAGNSGYSNVATGTTPAAGVPPDGNPGVLNVTYPGALTNISTRAEIYTGQPIIGGFVVVGGPVTVLIRGAGPALLPFGVPDALTDPAIQLIGGEANDDWTGQPISDAAAKVGAFAFAPGSKDAALLVTLKPGQYTVHLTGKAGMTGTALVEVYLVP